MQDLNPNDSSIKIEQIKSSIQEIQKDFHKKYPRIIGKGGFGHIILNQTQDTGNKYVVKKADKTKKENTNQLQFYDTILGVRDITKDYYPTIYATDKDILHTYIVMEYLDPNDGWKSLNDIYINNYSDENSEKINVEQYFPIMNDILTHFHEKNIIHNDIKNENIMINIKTNAVKFIDFGFSFTDKTCGRDIKILLKGTPAHMLPINEEPNVTEERIMELGKKKDRFALKVCEFYKFFEKPFLLDIPLIYTTNFQDFPLAQVYHFFYRSLMKIPPSTYNINMGLIQRNLKAIYYANKQKYNDQKTRFEEMFAEFINK